MSDHWNEGWSESTVEGALIAKADQLRDTEQRDHVKAMAYRIGVQGETNLDLLARSSGATAPGVPRSPRMARRRPTGGT